jgi:RNA 3'-terminal phosphate cyclase (ATP)
MNAGQHLVIDGSYGEGGGQLLRTSLAISAITGRPVVIEHIRANRRNPGLAAQHVTAVLAAAELCAAEIDGATLGSETLRFRPTVPPRPGVYAFDVAESREGGSCGATTLVLQTVALPAFFADGECEFRIRGGTHVAWSPPYDYVADVWRPFLAGIGVALKTELTSFGFYPRGEGEIIARVQGRGQNARNELKPVEVIDRGALRSIRGRAVAANLPSHIPQRMADRAHTLLAELAPCVDIRPERVRAANPGAGIFLTAEYQDVICGFSALGTIGKASETVAEEAVADLLRHAHSDGALDRHLADQALLPLALGPEPSMFTCEAVTQHLRTEAWVIEQFGIGEVVIEERNDGSAHVSTRPSATVSTMAEGVRDERQTRRLGEV